MTMIAMTAVVLFSAGSANVLIVADELPAMQVLAEGMKALDRVESRIVRQSEMPADLRGFDAVIVYIHGRLDEGPEQAMLAYAEGGGKLILLHHSISSGKRANKRWFPKLGVELATGDVEAGGYKWIEGLTLEVCNLAPKHPITRNGVAYPMKVAFTDSRGRQAMRDGFALEHSEVYINHKLSGRRTTLLGFRYVDAATGKAWTQPTAGWLMRLGKGHVLYFMPGHTVEEFRHLSYLRIVTNAVVWKP
ncbi:MAG: ThuA domain-containing protein [Armatimonadetes bacterium]|nr:ThuA domain-containing protein [Armatimonadota bacterium]